MAEHYRNGPDKTVERPGIARRSSECQVDCVNLLIPGSVEIVAPGPGFSSIDMPSVDELVTSVRDFSARMSWRKPQAGLIFLPEWRLITGHRTARA